MVKKLDSRSVSIQIASRVLRRILPHEMVIEVEYPAEKNSSSTHKPVVLYQFHFLEIKLAAIPIFTIYTATS